MKLRIERLLRDIQRHVALIRRSTKWESGLKKEQILEIQDKAGKKLPASLRKFYQNFSSISLHWKLPEGHPNISYLDPELDQVFGSTTIRSINQVIIPWEDNCENWPDWKDWVSDEKDEKLSKLKKLHVIECHPGEALIGFFSGPKQMKDRLYYFDAGNDVFFDLELKFAQYIEQLAHFRGIWKWQLYKQTPKAYESRVIKHYLPQIFDVDLKSIPHEKTKKKKQAQKPK